MSHGVSAGGGQSSIGSLVESGQAPKATTDNAAASPKEVPAVTNPAPAQPVDVTEQISAGINSTSSNNYLQADGQNTGIFLTLDKMGHGVSAGGGQSSLGYLIESGEAPKAATDNAAAPPKETPSVAKPAPTQPVDVTDQIPAGINSTSSNNYLRADGQNTGIFLTD